MMRHFVQSDFYKCLFESYWVALFRTPGRSTYVIFKGYTKSIEILEVSNNINWLVVSSYNNLLTASTWNPSVGKCGEIVVAVLLPRSRMLDLSCDLKTII